MNSYAETWLSPPFRRAGAGGESLAKETMQAVSNAEEQAHRILREAELERDRLLAEAEDQAKSLRAGAEKEAAKRVNVLVGVAKADGEKLQAKAAQDTREEQEALRQRAAQVYPQAEALVREILFGPVEGR